MIRRLIKRLAWWKRPCFYLATYGNAGLLVTFYRSKEDMADDLANAEQLHDSGGWDIDSYIWDEIPDEV